MQISQLNCERRKPFCLRSGTRQACLLSPLPFNIGVEKLGKKKIKSIQNRKEEVKLSLFTDDTHTQTHTVRTNKKISEFARYKATHRNQLINTQ